MLIIPNIAPFCVLSPMTAALFALIPDARPAGQDLWHH